jgi:hypothetical protein
MRRYIIYFFLFSMVFISCRFTTEKRIRGNGTITILGRSVSSFSGVSVSGDIDLYIKQDSVSSVKIEADENLHEYIHITVKGNILEIKEERGYNLQSSKGIKVYISGPSFNHFEASGACEIFSENKITGTGEIRINMSGAGGIKLDLNAPSVRAELSGASYLSLSGETKSFKVDGSGASGIRCFNLITDNTEIDISGAAKAEVVANVKLDVHVSGAADVKYKGTATVNQQVSGAGSVKKVEAP